MSWDAHEIMDSLDYKIEELTAANKDLRTDLAAARALLQRVLACGLCEEPHGVGFTPSKQERRAAELVQAINAALSGKE